MNFVKNDNTDANAVIGRTRVGNAGGLRIEKFRNPYPPGHANHGVHMYNVVRRNGRAVVKGENAAISTAVTHLQANRRRSPRARYNQGGYYKNTGASNVNLEGTTRSGRRYNIHMDYNQRNALPHRTTDKQPIAESPNFSTQLMNASGNPSIQGSSIHVTRQ
jgi:hypothetical protein